ncbi:MAG TPA: hypothetical protein VKA34_04840, partial [Balneolales bacterium]|nr:hypothetical protein [Balneolales bacterium]
YPLSFSRKYAGQVLPVTDKSATGREALQQNSKIIKKLRCPVGSSIIFSQPQRTTDLHSRRTNIFFLVLCTTLL